MSKDEGGELTKKLFYFAHVLGLQYIILHIFTRTHLQYHYKYTHFFFIKHTYNFNNKY